MNEWEAAALRGYPFQKRSFSAPALAIWASAAVEKQHKGLDPVEKDQK